MNFWLYIILYVIIGIPLLGYIAIQLKRLGSHLYSEYPIIKKFFDDYASHYAIGLMFTVIAGLMYWLARWLGYV